MKKTWKTSWPISTAQSPPPGLPGRTSAKTLTGEAQRPAEATSVCERNPVARITCRDAAFNSFLRPHSAETWTCHLVFVPLSRAGPVRPRPSFEHQSLCVQMVYVKFHKCHSGSHLLSQSHHMLMAVIKEAATCSPTDRTYGLEPYVCLRSPGFLSSSAFSVHPHTHTCGTLFHIRARRSPSNVARAAI